MQIFLFNPKVHLSYLTLALRITPFDLLLHVGFEGPRLRSYSGHFFFVQPSTIRLEWDLNLRRLQAGTPPNKLSTSILAVWLCSTNAEIELI